jgi:3-phenylpropionate/trans-cinnamate dioxygenase ferredoxin reductase component
VSKTFVIIGAGVAGVGAAATLRGEGFDGRVVLVSGEHHLPYDRPPLSKALLQGAESAAGIELRPERFYAEEEIDLRLGTEVTRLLPKDRRVVLATGETLHADKVLLCTGGVPRRLDVPGADLEGIHYLRSLDDAIALRAALGAGVKVVIVGAGWIGAEVAASARELGCAVTLLDIEPVPFARAVGADIGNVYAQLHRDRGVDLRTGLGVTRFEGGDRVCAVVTSDGRALPADVVVVGIGMAPATALAEEAGIAVAAGIVVDEYGETSVAGVYAAGDAANCLDARTGRRVRREHWQHAWRHASATAKSMLGRRQPFGEVPWFWSDQYGISLQVAGDPAAADEVVRRGDAEDLCFAAFHLQQGRLVAAVGVNRPRDVRAAMRLIELGCPVDRADLADPGVDLRRLLKRAVA